MRRLSHSRQENGHSSKTKADRVLFLSHVSCLDKSNKISKSFFSNSIFWVFAHAQGNLILLGMAVPRHRKPDPVSAVEEEYWKSSLLTGGWRGCCCCSQFRLQYPVIFPPPPPPSLPPYFHQNEMGKFPRWKGRDYSIQLPSPCPADRRGPSWCCCWCISHLQRNPHSIPISLLLIFSPYSRAYFKM